MSLITEDGTGRSDAESYASVSYADAYHAARANTAWAALSTTDKEVNLRKATDYMLQVYRGMWKGHRMLTTQALDWPRYGACQDQFPVLPTVVPLEVQKACCELALKASAGVALLADQGPQVVAEKVGPIEVQYQPGGRQGTKFAAIDAMLSSLTGGSGIRVVRA
jgi:hypothetical protein